MWCRPSCVCVGGLPAVTDPGSVLLLHLLREGELLLQAGDLCTQISRGDAGPARVFLLMGAGLDRAHLVPMQGVAVLAAVTLATVGGVGADAHAFTIAGVAGFRN